MTRASTQINREPSRVMAHRGMLSINPTLSMMATISSGSVVALRSARPDESMMVEIMPWATRNRAVMSSIPYITAAWARIKRTKHLKAISGFFSSVKLPQVLTTPITKNSTRRA